MREWNDKNLPGPTDQESFLLRKVAELRFLFDLRND